jgi:AraC-like DNA-binding protein
VDACRSALLDEHSHALAKEPHEVVRACPDEEKVLISIYKGENTGSAMTPEIFATNAMRQGDQRDAWREWFSPMLEVIPREPFNSGFPAMNTVWKLDGIVVSRISAPAVRVKRTPSHLRRNPIDHWVLSFCQRGEMTIITERGSLSGRPGVPFLWSLGEPSDAERADTERLQLFLSRDAFQDIAPLLDAARGTTLDTPLGRLLGDFMLSLEHRLQGLSISDMPRLTTAARALIAACVAPSIDRMAGAKNQLDHRRRERVRQTIRAHLRSPKLSPTTLARAVGMSRSNLYRLFEGDGGVVHYIQKQRLLEAHRTLTDPKITRSISSIADELCFSDASSFSRAFRTMFDHSASEVRFAAAGGLVLPGIREKAAAMEQPKFSAFLQGL